MRREWSICNCTFIGAHVDYMYCKMHFPNESSFCVPLACGHEITVWTPFVNSGCRRQNIVVNLLVHDSQAPQAQYAPLIINTLFHNTAVFPI